MIQAPVKIVDDELPTVTFVKYLGSLFTSAGCSQADVNFNGKQKTKVVWPLLEARTQPHLSEIAKTRRFLGEGAEADRKSDGGTTYKET